MLNIRRMTKDDLEKVVGIENETFSEPWTLDSFAHSLECDNDIYLVAEEDGEIAGYCGLWGVIDEGQITNVAVAREFRRKGVGRQLLTRLIEEAKAHKYSVFTLEVRVSNKPAIALYEQLGFVKEGIRRDYYRKPREDAVIMWYRSR